MAGSSLRHFIDLIEGKKSAPQQPWGVTVSPLFTDSLKKTRLVFADIDDKLKKFIEVKSVDPIQNKYGKHDGPFTGAPLKGFYHAHLRDDAIIVYNLKNRAINLVCILPHSEIEGRRKLVTSKILQAHK